MCGRFSLSSSPEELARRFGLEETPVLAARFNVAPGQDVATVSVESGGGRRALVPRRWGLIPSWARDPRIGNRLINARSESAAEKRAFRAAFERRRCLVPADGFYEWAGVGAARRPHHITAADGLPFGIAGLWEQWIGPGGEVIDSCTLLTTAANACMERLHDRMPVILDPGQFEAWLDPRRREPTALQPLLRPYPGAMTARPVSGWVNDTRHDDPACLEAGSEQLPLL
jgi:putative SOS response-associated peptidase YedK